MEQDLYGLLLRLLRDRLLGLGLLGRRHTIAIHNGRTAVLNCSLILLFLLLPAGAVPPVSESLSFGATPISASIAFSSSSSFFFCSCNNEHKGRGAEDTAASSENQNDCHGFCSQKGNISKA